MLALTPQSMCSDDSGTRWDAKRQPAQVPPTAAAARGEGRDEEAKCDVISFLHPRQGHLPWGELHLQNAAQLLLHYS